MVGLSVLIAVLVGTISHYKYKQTIIEESYQKLLFLVESHGKDLEKQINFIENYSLILESVLNQTFSWDLTKSDQAFDKYAQRVIPLLDTIAQYLRTLVGLGLTISKKLIEIMRGDIWLESVENKETKVFFTVPYKPAENITK